MFEYQFKKGDLLIRKSTSAPAHAWLLIVIEDTYTSDYKHTNLIHNYLYRVVNDDLTPDQVGDECDDGAEWIEEHYIKHVSPCKVWRELNG